MTEKSMLWETGSTGDGAAAGYTQAETTGLFEMLLHADSATAGVSSKAYNKLAATPANGASPTISIASGAALMRGLYYWSDAAVVLPVTKPAIGDTGLRVVLRASGGVTRTVRLAVKMSADGVSALPGITQDAGFPATLATTWEVPLYSAVVDTSGVIWQTSAKAAQGVTDERTYFDALVARRQGGSATDWAEGWSGLAATNYRPGRSMMQVGSKKVWYDVVDDGIFLGAQTFPVAFASPPMVFLQIQAVVNGGSSFYANVTSVSASQMNALIQHVGTVLSEAELNVQWLAIGAV